MPDETDRQSIEREHRLARVERMAEKHDIQIGQILDGIERLRAAQETTGIRLENKVDSIETKVGDLKLDPVRKAVETEDAERHVLEARVNLIETQIADLKVRAEVSEIARRELHNAMDRDHQWFVREMDKADIQGQRDRLEQLHHLESLIYDMTPAQE